MRQCMRMLQVAEGPYQAIQRLLRLEKDGVRQAHLHYEQQFVPHYRKSLSTDFKSRSTLSSFVGRHEEIEPFCLLMMKVLCDLKRLEDVRLLFALAVRELRAPSIELFNVYLMAISWTDTFTQDEIENVLQLMSQRKIEPNIVTDLCCVSMRLRLGDDSATEWQSLSKRSQAVVTEASKVVAATKAHAEGRDAVLQAMKQACPDGFVAKLRQCFNIALHTHYDPSIAFDSFRLLREVDPQGFGSTTLLHFVLLSVANGAVLARQVVEILDALTTVEQHAGQELEIVVAKPTEAPSPAGAQVQISEPTAFRILAKCAREKDTLSFTKSFEYFERHDIISSRNLVYVHLLKAHLHVASENLAAIVDIVEEQLPEEAVLWNPNARSLFITFEALQQHHSSSKRVLLVSQHPIDSFVRTFVRRGPSSVDDLHDLLEKRHKSGKAVTAKSLNLALAICAGLHDSSRAREVLLAFRVFRVKPSIESLLYVLRSYSDPNLAIAQHDAVLQDALDQCLDSTHLLPAMLSQCADAGHVAAAMKIVREHVKRRLPLDRLCAVRLLKLLCRLVDEEGVRETFEAMRDTGTRIDAAAVSLCIASLRRWGVSGEDLRRFQASEENR